MLRPRIIPCLLIQNHGLVKTVKFSNPKYVGDPLNAVRIFNEMEVDELMILDIDASRTGSSPNEALIAQLAAECRMPLCYGGGVKNTDQIARLIALGIEKVAISSAAVDTPELIPYAMKRVGSQSIVVVIDIKTTGLLRRPEVVTLNATKRTGLEPIAFAQRVEELGAGEIILNSVDRDGTMAGYDLSLAARIRKNTHIPLSILGGAGHLDHLRELIEMNQIIGAAAGSLFVFKGKYRAVLINYPSHSEREQLIHPANGRNQCI